MYIRETRRRNKDGSVVGYLQLAHNERHPETGTPVAKIIHSFGRSEQVDREALRRLVASISRFLDPAEAMAAGSGLDVEVVDARRYGGAFVLDTLFARLGIGRALRQAAEGRRLDAALVERILFALVAQRALEPGSKLAATRPRGRARRHRARPPLRRRRRLCGHGLPRGRPARDRRGDLPRVRPISSTSPAT